MKYISYLMVINLRFLVLGEIHQRADTRFETSSSKQQGIPMKEQEKMIFPGILLSCSALDK